MGPRDTKDSTNGNFNSAGKGKEKTTSSSNLSNASLGGLTQDDVDAGISATRQISKILCFMKAHDTEISEVDKVYGLGVRQQEQIKGLQKELDDILLRKNHEMVRLQEENDEYHANAGRLERERAELKQEQATMDDRRTAMEAEMQRRKDKEISEMKQQFSDRLKAKVKQVREELESKIRSLEMDKNGLEDTINILEKKNNEAQHHFNQQREGFELEKRSSQSHIISLESELRQMNALSTVSPQIPEFYADGFRRLWEGIRGMAFHDFKFLPEDGKSLDNDTVRNQLSTASRIFKYPLLSSESAVATFLRACAIQNFLSAETVSLIKRQYFAEPSVAGERKSGREPMDSILNTISNVPAATSSQDLSWRLTTVHKLDHLGPTAAVSTEPDKGEMIQTILSKLHYFQGSSERGLQPKLAEIAGMAIKLWSALRKDSCRIDVDDAPSTGDGKNWEFVDYKALNSPDAPLSPTRIAPEQLPPTSFVLFPRITGFFGSEGSRRYILHEGSALSYDSPAFRESLQEVEHINYATKELKRGLRPGFSSHSSPVMEKRPSDWPPLQSGS